MFAGTPAQGLGLPYMMGPTGGYLLGYVPAAFAIGFFAERGAARSVPQLLGAMALGHAILFATGYAWLARLIGPAARRAARGRAVSGGSSAGAEVRSGPGRRVGDGFL